ncbi:hypothetical protein IAU59_004843 [Kwoniella sp. CBS 9459]
MPPRKKTPTAASGSAVVVDTIWQVHREIDDEFGTSDEVRGTYYLFSEARAAAKADLLSEWDLDAFETYPSPSPSPSPSRSRNENENENGGSDGDQQFELEATFIEGELARVWVEKIKLPPWPGVAQLPLAEITNRTDQGPTARSRAPAPAPVPVPAQVPAPAQAPAPALPGKVYIILESTTEHHTDRVGRTKIQSKFAYTSLKEANAAAYKVYKKKHHSPFEEDYYNDGSETECFHGEKRVAMGKIDFWYVDVKEMDLVVPKVKQPRGAAAGGGGGKGKKRASTGGNGTTAGASASTSASAGSSKKQRTSLSGATAGGDIVDLTADD